uniref:Uncharacterized protein n=1 Tax=Arundo donax TaxID=35708 RepID=A0A0A8Z0Q8_ARUDO
MAVVPFTFFFLERSYPLTGSIVHVNDLDTGMEIAEFLLVYCYLCLSCNEN